MTTSEIRKALKDNINLVDTQVKINTQLATVYSTMDTSMLPKLDTAREELMLVLVDLTQQLTDVDNAEIALINEFRSKLA